MFIHVLRYKNLRIAIKIFLTFLAFVLVFASLAVAFLDTTVLFEGDIYYSWLVIIYTAIYFYLLSLIGDKAVDKSELVPRHNILASGKDSIFSILLFVSVTVETGFVVAFLCLWLLMIVKFVYEGFFNE